MQTAGAARASALPRRPRFEVADIFRAHGQKYLASHPLDRAQRVAMWCIEACRTAILRGYVDVCLDCSHERAVAVERRPRHGERIACGDQSHDERRLLHCVHQLPSSGSSPNSGAVMLFFDLDEELRLLELLLQPLVFSPKARQLLLLLLGRNGTLVLRRHVDHLVSSSTPSTLVVSGVDVAS